MEKIIDIGDLVWCNYGFSENSLANYTKLKIPVLATVVSLSEHVFTVVHQARRGCYFESFSYLDLLQGEVVEKVF